MKSPHHTANPPVRYVFKAVALKQLVIPVFSGSMIRGAIGHALLDRCCTCGTEHHRSGCLYQELFETPAGNAFVISPPKQAVVAPGQTFSFRLTLLGPTPEREQAMLAAVERALDRGLTPQRIPCRLTSTVSQQPSPHKLGKMAFLHLNSPWFIKRSGERVGAQQCSVHTLLIGIAQRQRALREQGLLDVTVPTNSELLPFADELTGQLRLQDYRGERHSNRQRGAPSAVWVYGHRHPGRAEGANIGARRIHAAHGGMGPRGWQSQFWARRACRAGTNRTELHQCVTHQ